MIAYTAATVCPVSPAVNARIGKTILPSNVGALTKSALGALFSLPLSLLVSLFFFVDEVPLLRKATGALGDEPDDARNDGCGR